MSQSLSPSRESKFSRKAEAVYAALAGTKAHPSAEQLYLSLKEVYPNISKTTVYSNLAKLRDDGAVVCVAVVDGRERFDANTMAHPHFICSCCGSVLDLEGLPDVSSLPRAAEAHNAVRISSLELVFRGLCGNCCTGGTQHKHS